MKKLTTSIFIALATLLFVSCKMQEQIRTVHQIIQPASHGDVSSTLSEFDKVKRFRNPLVNMKYQSLKKKYFARFANQTEKNKTPSENLVINDICSIYHTYWKTKLLNLPIDSDSILYGNIAHYLVDNKLTNLKLNELSETITDNSELTKVIEQEGYYSLFRVTNEIKDLLIWSKQTTSNYSVVLPQNKIDVNVIFLENYCLKGIMSYSTFGSYKIGGWASSSSSSLFCNKGSYRLQSEKFKFSYLKHESLHFVDLKNYPNLESADLEYRAKLAELSYCTKKTVYRRLEEFIIGASNKTRDKPHPYANYYIINNLSKELFGVEFELNISKWKNITYELINETSLDLLQQSSQTLDENPLLKRII